MALISTLAVWIGGAAALMGQDTGPEVKVEDTLALMRELAVEPRIPGTGGYDRAVDLIEASIRARGVPVERIQVSASRAVPTRSDVLLFEDSTATAAFAGLRERWSPDAVPAQPLPAGYGFNVEKGDVRGAVVDAGRGSVEDFKRLASLRILADGAIALVHADPAPLFRERVAVLVERAAEAGFAGILVAPSPQSGKGGTLPAEQLVLEDQEFGNVKRLPIPAAPIRAIEAAAIRDRLRVKRVRGEDGKATSLKLGPGPVEVQIAIECPLTELASVPALLAGFAAKEKPRVHVPIDQSWNLPLQGAGLAAVAAGAVQTGDPIRRLLLAPRSTMPPRATFQVGNALAAMEGLTEGESLSTSADRTADSSLPEWPEGRAFASYSDRRFGGRTRCWPSYETSLEAWDRHLGGELSKRTGAATVWIDYLLRSRKFRAMSQVAPGEPILAASIPVLTAGPKPAAAGTTKPASEDQ